MTRPRTRRIVRDLSRLLALCSAVMLAVTTATLFRSGSVEAAGELKGTVTVREPGDGPALTTGGGSAIISIVPPLNAACPGGATSTPSYRWQTFLVGASVDASTLTYGGQAPNPVPNAFVAPLFDGSFTAVVNKNPATTPLGLITDIPTFSFEGSAPPPGSYKFGYACTAAGQTVSYWQANVTIAASSDSSGFSWTLAAAPPPSSSTSTTTTAVSTTSTVATTTSTTIRPATTTTTTVAGATTTTSTVAGATTTTAVASNAVTTAPPFVPPTGGSGGIPVTGGGTAAAKIALWSLLLMVFGRMAVLFGRPVRVTSDVR